MARFDIDAALAEANQGRKFDVDAGLQSATARASGADLPSPVQGFVTAMQGPLFGFLDEMTGAIQGAKSLLPAGITFQHTAREEA